LEQQLLVAMEYQVQQELQELLAILPQFRFHQAIIYFGHMVEVKVVRTLTTLPAQVEAEEEQAVLELMELQEDMG